MPASLFSYRAACSKRKKCKVSRQFDLPAGNVGGNFRNLFKTINILDFIDPVHQISFQKCRKILQKQQIYFTLSYFSLLFF